MRIFSALLICSALFASSCSRVSTRPSQAYFQIRNEVHQRTGQEIHWDKLRLQQQDKNEILCQTLSKEMTLDDLIKVSLLNNYRLQAHYEDLGIAQAQLLQATLWKNPVFSASFRYQNLVESASIIEMGLVQNFLDILLKPLKTKLACTELQKIQTELIGDILVLIGQIKIWYHELLASEQSVLLEQDSLQILEASYEMANSMYEVGNIPLLERSITQANFENDKINLSKAQVNAFNAREKLSVLMGLCGNDIHWELKKAPFEISEYNHEIEFLKKTALEKSLDLKYILQDIKATATRVGIDISETVVPQFGLGPDSEKEAEGTWYVGPQFSIGIPIFDWGQAQKTAGYAELSKRCKEYQALCVEILSTVRNEHFQLKKAANQYFWFQNTIIPLKEKVTRETHDQYNAMQLGTFQLLMAKQQEVQAKMEAVVSYRNYWIARTKLETLLNGKMASFITPMSQ